MAMFFKKWKWIGEGDADKAAADKAATERAAADEAARKALEGDTEKKFTQKDLDRVINTRFAKEKTEKEQLIKQLENLKEKTGLSETEKTDLQKQIDTLNESVRTKEEQSQFEKKQLETKFKTDIDTLLKEKDTWKSRFYDSTVKRAITDAAVSAGGEFPEQFVLMFSGATRLEEEKDEGGKLTGNFIPKIKFQGMDPETKKSVTLDLPIAEAFPKMRELGMHKNLFKHGANSGTGQGSSGQNGGQRDESKPPDWSTYNGDSERYGKDYQAWRAKYDHDGKAKQTSK